MASTELIFVKLVLGMAVAICLVGMGGGDGYAISGGIAGNTHYVSTTTSTPRGIHNIGNPKYFSSGRRYNYIYLYKKAL